MTQIPATPFCLPAGGLYPDTDLVGAEIQAFPKRANSPLAVPQACSFFQRQSLLWKGEIPGCCPLERDAMGWASAIPFGW